MRSVNKAQGYFSKAHRQAEQHMRCEPGVKGG
jgi:hypothetical protein